MTDHSKHFRSLQRFIDQHNRLAMLLIEADFESVVAAYQTLLESNGQTVECREVEVLASSSGDVFANPTKPAPQAVVGFRDGDWTLVQHRFSDLTFSDVQLLNSQITLLHEVGRVLRFVAMGKAIRLECDLTGINHPKEVFHRQSEQGLRCSLVNEFDEFAAEMGIDLPSVEGEAIADFDELVGRFGATFVAVGLPDEGSHDDFVTVASREIRQIERVALLR